MDEKQKEVESDKYSHAKELRAYRIVIHGEIPAKITERLSAIHAQAILKTRSRAIADSHDHIECQVDNEV